jgi:hypothetical protein
LYNFEAFSTDSFEQFSRALSIKLLGPGVTAFGNGPDGGREATFNGKVNFPFPPTEVWDGYGVLQAKFKEKNEGTQKDQAWAETQLKSELNTWINSNKRNPKPDYFIFATNVELTSTKNGGRDRLTSILNAHKVKLNLKGWSIWDANQLRSYLDGQSEIRQRFLQFFTPGDLLAQFSKLLPRLPNPDAVLTRYLAHEILADEDARLSQAGDRSEDRIKLAQVFIDLPAGKKPSHDVHGEIQPRDLPGSLKKLLRVSGQKLDPLALRENVQQPRRRGVELDDLLRDSFFWVAQAPANLP